MAAIALDTHSICKHHAKELDAKLSGKVICISDVVVAEKVNSPDYERWALDDFARLYYHRDNIYCVLSLPYYL